MKTDKHLEEHIKKAMENLETPLGAGAWEAFQEQLESQALSGNELFDKVFQEKLENLEAPLQTGAWDSMQKMIEADEAATVLENETALDNVIYEKVSNIEIHSRQQHWQLMAQRLEQEFTLRYELYRYKIAEVSLMILLLLAMVRFFPLLENADPGQKAEGIASQAGILFQPSSPGEIQQPAHQQNGTLETVQSVQQQITPASITAVPPEKTPKAERNNPQMQLPSTGGSLFSRDGNLKEVLLAGLHYISSLWTNPFAERITGDNLFHSSSKVTDLQLKFDLLEQTSGTKNSKYVWEVNQVAKQQVFSRKDDLRLSIFTNTDVNYVYTPSSKLNVFDTLVAAGSGTMSAIGYGGGVLVSWKKGKWEFQTGGIYSLKRYNPDTTVLILETVNRIIQGSFDGIQLNILQAPLNLKYRFADGGKWRLYGLGGVSGHLVTYQKEYPGRYSVNALMAMPSSGRVEDLASQKKHAFDEPFDYSNLQNKNFKTNLESGAITVQQEKDFPRGLFEGGNLQHNYFLSANLGLEVERYLSSRWSIFLQPNYQHYLMSEGIGINKDKFYTFSIYLGTKFNLK